MDQQQVDIVQLQPFQARFACGLGAVKTVPLAVELRGYEYLITRYRGIANALTYTTLVLVVLSCIDQAIAQLQWVVTVSEASASFIGQVPRPS